jgi:hypothetical protein
VEIRLLHAGEPSRPFRAELAGARRAANRRAPRLVRDAAVPAGALQGGGHRWRQLYLGSANWTGAGLGAKGEGRRNFELGFVTADDLLLDEVQSLYEEVWRGARCAGCRLRQDCPGPLDMAPSCVTFASRAEVLSGCASAAYQRRERKLKSHTRSE